MYTSPFIDTDNLMALRDRQLSGAFEKCAPVLKTFYVHTRTKLPTFSNSSVLKSVFEKVRRFHDGLEWTVGLTVEIRLRVVWMVPRPPTVADLKEFP